MAQTQQPMGSSPLANQTMQGQVWRGPVPGQQPANLAQMGGPLGNYGAIPTAQNTTGMQTPQMANLLQQLQGQGGGPQQKALGAIQGMQRRPPPGAPGQGPGAGKGGGPGAQQMKQQIAGLQGAPPLNRRPMPMMTGQAFQQQAR